MTPVLRSADIWISTTVNGRIRALMLDRRITPTSTTRRSQRQHEFRRRCGSLLCLGYALLAQHPTTVYTEPIGRRSTYRRRNAVSSRPSTSAVHLAAKAAVTQTTKYPRILEVEFQHCTLPITGMPGTSRARRRE